MYMWYTYVRDWKTGTWGKRTGELSFPEFALWYILSDEATTVGKVAEKVHVL